MIFQRKAFYDFQARSDEAGTVPVGVSLTVQSQSEDADINVIVRRFGITGQLPENLSVPSYGDFTGVSDYRTALMLVRSADESFMKLPAEIRSRFDNSPGAFLRFVESSDSDAHRAELKAMGLLVPDKVVVPEVIQKVEIVKQPEPARAS